MQIPLDGFAFFGIRDARRAAGCEIDLRLLRCSIAQHGRGTPEGCPDRNQYDARMGWREQFRQGLATARQMDWSTLRADAWVYCAPVNAAVLAAGLWWGRPRVAVAVVAAAVSVGFGAYHQLTRLRAVPMVVVTVGFAISAWVGAVIGRESLWTSLAVAIVWGFVFGGVTQLGPGAWWVGLQCVIALFVSSAYPAGLWPATQRVMLILAGGGLQAGWTLLVWRLRRESLMSGEIVEPFTWNLEPTRLGVRHPMGDLGLRYAVRVAGVLAAGVVVAHHWGERHGNMYWIPMTAAIVLKIDFRTTFARGIARLAGTVIGAAVVTAATATLRPPPAVLAALLVLSLWACFAVQKVNYGLFAVFITAYVVLLLALLGLPEQGVALRRTAATLIGGALALGSFAVLPPGKAKQSDG